MIETSPYDVKIQNVVASATLDQKIDLLDIVKVGPPRE
jgi:TATA-box binding protein (TBP) (component of TFIID and TFIIIB)